MPLLHSKNNGVKWYGSDFLPISELCSWTTCILLLTGGLLGTGKVQSRGRLSAENPSLLHYSRSHVGNGDRGGNCSSNTSVDSNVKDKWKLTNIIMCFITASCTAFTDSIFVYQPLLRHISSWLLPFFRNNRNWKLVKSDVNVSNVLLFLLYQASITY